MQELEVRYEQAGRQVREVVGAVDESEGIRGTWFFYIYASNTRGIPAFNSLLEGGGAGRYPSEMEAIAAADEYIKRHTSQAGGDPK